MRRTLLPWLLLLCLPNLASSAGSPYVPPELEAWREWVLHKHPEAACPMARHCTWPTTLKVQATPDGAQFEFTVHTFSADFVELPGARHLWPQALVANGEPAPVIPRGDRPAVHLPPGSWQLSGELPWAQIPESIPIPANIAQIVLSVNGQAVPGPLLRGNNLFLTTAQTPPAQTEQETAQVQVFRDLREAAPLELRTQLRLRITGAPRELRLGRVLPDDFRLARLDSALPARLEEDGTLRILARAGTFTITIDALHVAPLPEQLDFELHRLTSNWPEQEVWTYQSDPSLRVTRIEGVPAIDPEQTATPFRNGATYLLDTSSRISLVETQRGDLAPAPDAARLRRTLWLDFDGAAFTVVDDLQAQLNAPRRLESDSQIERAVDRGRPLVLTRGTGASGTGVEMSAGEHALQVISRMPRSEPVPLSVFTLPLEAAEASLVLPPGWELLAVTGADQAPGSWVSRWTLLDVFILLISVLVAHRLLGTPGAALMVIAMGVGYHAEGALRWSWLALMATAVGAQLAPNRGAWRLLRVVHIVAALSVAGLVLNLTAARFSDALYPNLAEPHMQFSPSMDAISAGAVAYDSAPELADAVIEEVQVSAVRRASPPPKPVETALDADEAAQIGRGVPRWEWNRTSIRWDGPLGADARVSVWALPPVLTRPLHVLVALVSLILLAAIVRPMLPSRLLPWAQRWLPASSLAIAACLTFTPSQSDAASFPDPQLLQELRVRLLEPPTCAPTCSAYERVSIELGEDRLRISLKVHVQAESAVPLPADPRWNFDVAGRGGAVAAQRIDGRHHALLPAGVQTVELLGPIAGFDELKLTFPEVSGHVTIRSEGWSVSGLQQNRVPNGTLLLRRRAQTRDSANQALQPNEVEPFVTVERELILGREWSLHTTVSRRVPQRGPMTVRIPLTAGETVLSNEPAVRDGHAIVSFASGQRQVEWSSRLPNLSPVVLSAGPAEHIQERWTLRSTPRWHVEAQRLTPDVRQQSAQPMQWTPRANETLEFHITRPEPLQGPTFAIEDASLHMSPGARLRGFEFRATVNASTAQRWVFPLPEGSQITGINVDRRELPLPEATANLEIPLRSGEQVVNVQWRQPTPNASWMATPALKLDSGASNIDLSIAVPADRWVLAVMGPALGPAVVLWPLLAAILLAAWLAGYVPGMPGNRRDYLLLAVGLSLCNQVGLVLIAGWFLMFATRARYGDEIRQRWIFNGLQVALAVGTAVFLLTLLASVSSGLLSSPTMNISGNGSSASLLRWYADYGEQALPSGGVLSLPIWAYRGIMLLWSLWLAAAVLRWIREAWEIFSATAAWRAAPPKTEAPTQEGARPA